MLSTVTATAAIEPLLPALGIDGQLLILGAAMEPLAVSTASMIGGRQSLKAWPSGTCVDSEDALKFSVLSGVRAQIETMPLDRAPEAYQRMLDGDVRFRMVLTTGA